MLRLPAEARLKTYLECPVWTEVGPKKAAGTKVQFWRQQPAGYNVYVSNLGLVHASATGDQRKDSRAEQG